MPGIKELKTRIKSIGGMRKVTRAMQMVSASKMRKAQGATLASRTYSSLAWELIGNLEASSNATAVTQGVDAVSVIPEVPNASEGLSGIQNQEMHASDVAVAGGYYPPLLQSHPQAPKMAILALSSNRGLVGSLNANLLGLVEKTIKENKSEQGDIAEVDLIVYGRKAKEYSVRSGKNILADFEKFDRAIFAEDVYPIAKLISDLYHSGKYRKVLIAYNHFISTVAQKATVKQLLPFRRSDEVRLRRTKSDVSPTESSVPIHRPSEQPINRHATDYLFEPSPKTVFEYLLPRIIESQIYQAILENEASEQSARMVMMKNATEAAEDLISDLTLSYNKLRQNKITTELAEITAGKIALE